jgi:molybdopterin-guanine dinucleotide biosynthesis protein A
MGRDKASLMVLGQTLLHRQIAMMRPGVVRLFIVGTSDLEIPNVQNIIKLGDYYQGREGPLSGVLAALQASSADFLWLMPCDSYGVAPSLLEVLLQSLCESGADIAYLRCDDKEHPLMAVWRSAVKGRLLQYMEAGGRSVFKWYATMNVVAVEMDEVKGQFCNINTPADYQALLGTLC